MTIQHMTKITHVKITHYIDNTKNNANKCSNACCTFTDFPRDFQLNRMSKGTQLYKNLKQCEFYVNVLGQKKCCFIKNLNTFFKTLYETNFYFKVYYLENLPLNFCLNISNIENFINDFAKSQICQNFFYSNVFNILKFNAKMKFFVSQRRDLKVCPVKFKSMFTENFFVGPVIRRFRRCDGNGLNVLRKINEFI